MDRAADHWDQVYGSKATTEMSWYQREPSTSLRLITRLAPSPAAAVLDVGGGASVLVDRLVDAGYRDVTLLDVSEHALAEVRERLGRRADRVTFVRDDITTWEPDRSFDIWHDRAVFHFLIEPGDRDRYVALAGHTVRPGGAVVLATFAPDGPTHCSGLPVSRYSPDELAKVFSAEFSMIDGQREDHRAPTGATQAFTWVVLRRT